jgi:hypothetical protein
MTRRIAAQRPCVGGANGGETQRAYTIANKPCQEVDRPSPHQVQRKEERSLGVATDLRMPHFSWKLTRAIPMALWFTREV